MMSFNCEGYLLTGNTRLKRQIKIASDGGAASEKNTEVHAAERERRQL